MNIGRAQSINRAANEIGFKQMNKRYQIYGMGNALVDFEIETSLDELASHLIILTRA